ncbi:MULTISPECIES: HVO_2901 family zinc finger protein [Haloferax]|uniref:HVO_2901 family zinc finger protein n=2 Tax=Haloferacaceae TaxID=1644056 RepID=UPI0009D9E117|nr:HVO_2901 family zinc finger protein [Haloferax mediterranei]MDX5986677.1 HVO_2901 family zinc finger protein [Haloferax mediterranei ATCC 33500]
MVAITVPRRRDSCNRDGYTHETSKIGILKLDLNNYTSMAGLQEQRVHGRDMLECRGCGAVFPEGRATTDGWTYVCPECEEVEGIGQGLRRC